MPKRSPVIVRRWEARLAMWTFPVWLVTQSLYTSTHWSLVPEWSDHWAAYLYAGLLCWSIPKVRPPWVQYVGFLLALLAIGLRLAAYGENVFVRGQTNQIATATKTLALLSVAWLWHLGETTIWAQTKAVVDGE